MRQLKSIGRAAILSVLTLSAFDVRAQPLSSGAVYTADEKAGSVSVIDLRTETVKSVPVSVMPHNIQKIGRAHV